MKGIILAGGHGSRLYPLTSTTNKTLLPVFDKQMIYYPIETLRSLGCTEIMIVSGREHSGQIIDLLGSGESLNLDFTYRVQEHAGGIAHALKICQSFAGDSDIAVCLGDNIFEKDVPNPKFEGGAHIYIKEVPDPERFGVAEVNFNEVISIEEKPKNPKSNYCVTGLYLYDNKVWEIIDKLKPSKRGELEITDVNNAYVERGMMSYETVDGLWSDAGTPESLAHATQTILETNLSKELTNA